MDFIKENEQVKIDPNGIDISGAGNIFIDSNSVTGDISFNNKVSVSDDFDVTGDFNINGNINISGNNNFVITNDGNVGIGTTNPIEKLDVDGNILIKSTTSENTAKLIIENQRNLDGTNEKKIGSIEFAGDVHHRYTDDGFPVLALGSEIACVTDFPSGGYQADESRYALVFNTRQRDKRTSAYDDVTEAMRINGSGNVGIGITNPTYPLTVGGNIITQSDNSSIVVGKSSGSTTSANSLRLHYTTPTQNAYIDYNDTTTGLHIRRGSTNVMVFSATGYVGIGTSNPKFPLEVRGFAPSNNDSTNGSNYPEGRKYTSTAWSNQSAWYSATVSIQCKEGYIWALALFVSSDERVKTDISNIDDDRALQQVNALESKEYHYIDPMRKRPMKTIGFIAQEVKEVIPNAVTIQKDWVPDEMRIITDPQWTEDAGKWYLNIPDLDMSGNFTGKGKFYVSNDPSGNDEVCKEVDIKEVPTSSMNDFSTTNYVAEFDQSWNNVFFYGKEVNDFHTIDKAQIFALHHSAIQELDRKHEREVTEKNNKIQTLEGEVSNLTGQVLSLTSRLEALEASVLSLQNN